MQVWRLTRRDHAALDGEGARLYGGRWTSPGVPAVYTSSRLSLAVLEVLVNLDVPPDLLPSDYVAVEIRIPDDVAIDEAGLPARIEDAAYRGIGDAWAKTARAAVLGVPSVVVPRERNFIVNPKHPAARGIAVVGMEPFTLDPRLLKRKT